MRMRAGAPSWRAAHATAWPWFPALAATTPAARSSKSAIVRYHRAHKTGPIAKHGKDVVKRKQCKARRH